MPVSIKKTREGMTSDIVDSDWWDAKLVDNDYVSNAHALDQGVEQAGSCPPLARSNHPLEHHPEQTEACPPPYAHNDVHIVDPIEMREERPVARPVNRFKANSVKVTIAWMICWVVFALTIVIVIPMTLRNGN